MGKFRKRTLVLVGAATLGVCVSGGAVAGVSRATAGSVGPELQSVSAHRLAEDGMNLLPPNGAPSVTAAEAQATALQRFPQSQVRERVLAVVNDSHVHPAIDRLCWIVSIVPPGGIWSYGHHIQGTYDLLFIDAKSGQLFFGTQGG
jgi:hypothetical protein